jgi:hypothetical protein
VSQWKRCPSPALDSKSWLVEGAYQKRVAVTPQAETI